LDFCEDHTALQEKGPYLVDHSGFPSYETIPHTVQRLKIKLIICFDRNEAHVLAIDGLSNRFCIEEVVLVGLDEWLHKLSWNELDVVSLSS
jgi:hypothetical protein